MTIATSPFGRTGHESSRVIFGSAALRDVDQETADGVLDILLEHGVNHLDTAPRYGNAEKRIGPWMDRLRDRFFLATKTPFRDYQGTKDSIHRSLDLLHTDHVDLLQFHALHHPDDWDQVFAESGALEAVIEAQEQGLTRFIGVTGHSWTVAAMHQRSLGRFDFDSVLMPWNWQMAHHEQYPKDFEKTVALAQEKGAAIQTIKSLARGPWAAGQDKNRATWYQPLEDEADIRLAVHWVLARPELFLVSTGDVDILPHILKAANGPIDAPSDEAMTALAERAGLSTIFGM